MLKALWHLLQEEPSCMWYLLGLALLPCITIVVLVLNYLRVR